MANIRVLSDGGEDQFPLEAPVVTLGRGLECDVRLKDIKASRRHCQIVRIPEGFQVVDLSSGNGTYVNGIQIKQQRLEPGDKIQVGSTTITFQDAPPPAAPEKKAAPAATGSAPRLEAAPAAEAPAPAAPRKTSGGSSSSVPVASRSASESSSRSPSPTRRPGTLRASTRSPAPAGADGAPAPRKKSSPALVIVAVIGTVFAGVVGAILFSGSGDSGEQLAAAVKKLGEEARAAERAGRFDDADAKYRAILSKIEGKDRFRGEVVRINDARKELGERKALLADAPRRFGEIRTRAAAGKGEEAAALAREARQLISDAGETPFEWLRELREIADRLDRAAEAAGGGRRNDFDSRRAEVAGKYGLLTEAPLYGDAIAEWQSYAGGKNVSEENRAKAAAEIAGLQKRAREDFERLKVRAASLEKENRKAEALEELKKQRPRFKSTPQADDLEGAIGQLEK